MSLRKNARAFTIVELLVVIGIIGLLVGLLAPALSGVQKRARKAEELNNIRAVMQAWSMYAGDNNDAALMGYVAPAAQLQFRMTTLLPDKSIADPRDAAPWSWRLSSYLGDNHDLYHGYRDEDVTGLQAMIDEAEEIAEEPAFAYNSYHIGGWWDAGAVRPEFRFRDAAVDGTPVNVVARSVAEIRRSTEVVLFCSGGIRGPGVYKKVDADYPGCHTIEPTWFASINKWGLPGTGQGTGGGGGGGGGGGRVTASQQTGSTSEIEVFIETGVPIGRHNGKTVVAYPDGHAETDSPGSLADMRKWVDVATERNFKFTE